MVFGDGFFTGGIWLDFWAFWVYLPFSVGVGMAAGKDWEVGVGGLSVG